MYLNTIVVCSLCSLNAHYVPIVLTRSTTFNVMYKISIRRIKNDTCVTIVVRIMRLSSRCVFINDDARPLNMQPKLTTMLNQLSSPLNQMSSPLNQMSSPLNQMSSPLNQMSSLVKLSEKLHHLHAISARGHLLRCRV